MWEWYRIGLAAGLGASVGLLLAGLLAANRARAVAVIVVAAALGAVIGLALDDWTEAVGGGAGGLLGAAGAAAIVGRTLRRGGTRFGTAALITLGAVIAAALALVPGLGYLEAIVAPAVALRSRGRGADRYAGLRTLARD